MFLYTGRVPLTPTTGWAVLHLFCQLELLDADALRSAVESVEADG